MTEKASLLKLGAEEREWLEAHAKKTKRFMTDVLRTALYEYRLMIEAKERGDFRQSSEKDFLYESRRQYPWQ